MNLRRVLTFLALAWFGVSVCGAEVLSISKFSGLNTDDSPLNLQDGQTPDSENVLTDDGPGVQGRKGFIAFSTSTTSGLWEFPLSNGTRYIITKESGNLKAATSSGLFTITISTVPTDRIVVASPLGDKFYFADTLNGLKYWDGSTTVAVASAALTVDKLVTWKGRLAASGKSGTTRVIYLSKYLDGTSWTAPVNPSDDDAAQITVSGALDENIQALYSSHRDTLIWMKSNAFGGIFGSRRSNFTQRTFSDRVGVSSPETIQDCDGKLRWLGANRIVWEFDGATFYKISENVDTLFSTVQQGDSATRSLVQTTQADFQGGTQSPSTFGDTTTSPGSLTPKTTTFIDTANGDFNQGSDSVAGYLDYGSIASGTIQLGTETAVTTMVDTSQANFEAGTMTLVSSTQSVDDLQLFKTAPFNKQNTVFGGTPVDVCGLDPCGGYYQSSSFTANGTYFLNSVDILTSGQRPSDLAFRIMSDNSGVPGTVIESIDISAFSGALSTKTVTFSGTTVLTNGTRYWLQMFQGCSDFNQYTWFGGPTGDGSSGSALATYCDGTIVYRTSDYILRGSTYATSGNIVSRNFETGVTTNTYLWTWGALNATETKPAGTGITYETQTSADGVSFDALVSVANGANMASTVRRYIRYKATLTGGTTTTPTLSDVTLVNSTRIRPQVSFTSRSMDTGVFRPILGTLTVDTTTVGGSLSWFTQSSADNSSWDAAVSIVPGNSIGSTARRYLRYRADLAASSPTAYPTINSVTMTAKATGTFTTSALNVGTGISSWGPLAISLADNGGSFTIQFATSTDGVTFDTWNTVSNNAAPAVSTAPYAAVRLIFSLDVTTDTPTVSDITVNWTEGSTLRAASIFFNQRYWLSVAISSTSNNRILVYDKNKQWQRYSGVNAIALALYNSNLYFGNSTGISQAENGYSDAGASIASYYKTPTMAPAGMDSKSKYLWLYTTTDSSDSTLAATYQIDGSTTNYSFGSSAMNSTGGIQNIKTPFSVEEIQQGRLVSVKWSVPGTSFWRILQGNLFFDRDTIPE